MSENKKILHILKSEPDDVQKTLMDTLSRDRHSLQVSLAAPYPGTELYRQAMENGWLANAGSGLIQDAGIQEATGADTAGFPLSRE